MGISTKYRIVDDSEQKLVMRSVLRQHRTTPDKRTAVLFSGDDRQCDVSEHDVLAALARWKNKVGPVARSLCDKRLTR